MTREIRNINEISEINIIDKVAIKQGTDCSEAIKNFPREIKRTKLLKILAEDHNEESVAKFANIISKMKSTDSETKHIKNVVEMIREYVKVLPTEVKQFGEVMTPIELVQKMVNKLPYEVWTNPNLKWLDPCNGIGTFFSVVIEKLMKGLKNTIPNDKERYAHIVENMIYACELQPKNSFLYLYTFDPKDDYDLNIFDGSYLSEEFNVRMAEWGVEKFDVIVMNPPYNNSNNNIGTGNTLWDKFVIKTTNQLVEGGYLVAVHPDGWRNLSKCFDKVKKILKSKQLLYLEIHDTNDGQKTFGASTAYDFYCLRNVPNIVFTEIKCMDGTTQSVDISEMEFIPNGMYKEFEKLMPKKGEEKVNLLHSYSSYETRKSYMSKEQTEEFKYPVVYLTYADGSIKFMFSKLKSKGHFDVPKVIWSNGGASTPIIDEDGNYGMTDFACGIVDEQKNLPFIQKAMSHPDFLKLLSFGNGTTHRYNRRVIALFRKDFWKEFQY